MHFHLMFQEVRPISKTRNQLMDITTPIAVHYSERPLRASGGLARSAAAQQYRSVQSNHAAGRQGLNLGLAVTDL